MSIAGDVDIFDQSSAVVAPHVRGVAAEGAIDARSELSTNGVSAGGILLGFSNLLWSGCYSGFCCHLAQSSVWMRVIEGLRFAGLKGILHFLWMVRSLWIPMDAIKETDGVAAFCVRLYWKRGYDFACVAIICRASRSFFKNRLGWRVKAEYEEGDHFTWIQW